MLTPMFVLVLVATAVLVLACVRRIPEGHAYTLRRFGGQMRTVGAGIHVVLPRRASPIASPAR
jgi:regulator of protease activity HflC (stomatin/prohibitin superfamily)